MFYASFKKPYLQTGPSNTSCIRLVGFLPHTKVVGQKTFIAVNPLKRISDTG